MIILDNAVLSSFAHIDILDIPSKLFGLDVIGTLGILRLAYRRNLIDKVELGILVEMLRDILYFTEELEKWVLSNEKL